MTQDLVVPCYKPDLPLLKVLARSLARFDKDHTFQNLWLIVTDSTPISEIEYLKELDFRWRILYLDDIIVRHTGHGMSGYINQQIAKLVISRYVQADWMWIFDCKNFLIKHIDQSTLYKDGLAKVSVDYPSLHWKNSWKSCQELYGIKSKKVITNTTPYPIKTNLVRNMIDEFDSFSSNFADLFIRKNICEFFLYNAYILRENQFESYYKLEGLMRVTIWPNELKEELFQPENIRYLLENPSHIRPIWCGGLHRDAIKQMDKDQKSRWADILVYLNLFDSVAAVQTWFDEID